MTITITLGDEVENLLREKAAQRGVTLDSLAMEIFNQALTRELEQAEEVILLEEDGVLVVDGVLLGDATEVIRQVRGDRHHQNND